MFWWLVLIASSFTILLNSITIASYNMPINQPFHDGELSAQSAFEVLEEADYLGRRMIRPSIPSDKHPYLSSLTYIMIASLGLDYPSVDPWTSILFGEEGFLSVSQDGRHIQVVRAQIVYAVADPLVSNLQKNGAGPISIMALDFEYRNRYRINGHVVSFTFVSGLLSFTLFVEEALGNCPKYIQARTADDSLSMNTAMGNAKLPALVTPANLSNHTLTAHTAQLIANCDTMLMSTFHDDSHVSHATKKHVNSLNPSNLFTDITHRGGHSGFIRIISPNQLTWPDYSGNNMFMTLGNVLSSERAGLLFIDFEHEQYVQVTGRATVHICGSDGGHQVTASKGINRLAEPDQNFSMDGSSRFVVFTISEIKSVKTLPKGYFSLVSRSPFNPTLSGYRGLSVSKLTKLISTASNNDVNSTGAPDNKTTSSTTLPSLTSTISDHTAEAQQEMEVAEEDLYREIELTLSSATFLSPTVAQFAFTLSKPYIFAEVGARYVPGQYATIQVQLPFTTQRTDHQTSDNPTASASILIGSEDDTVHRSWTITSTANNAVTTNNNEDKHNSITGIEFTIKNNTTDGYISSWLHNFALSVASTGDNTSNSVDTANAWRGLQELHGLSFVLKGVSGDFSIYNTNYTPPREPATSASSQPNVSSAANVAVDVSGTTISATAATKKKKAVKPLSVFARSLEECSGRVLLLSGGIGVTPFLATIHSLFDRAHFQSVISNAVKSGETTVTVVDVVLIATFRSADEVKCLDQLAQYLEEQHNKDEKSYSQDSAHFSVKLSVHVVITGTAAVDNSIPRTNTSSSLLHPKHEDIVHVSYGARLSSAYLNKHITDLAGRDVYLCGPDAFMHNLSESLVSEECGVNAKHVHMEEFYF